MRRWELWRRWREVEREEREECYFSQGGGRSDGRVLGGASTMEGRYSEGVRRENVAGDGEDTEGGKVEREEVVCRERERVRKRRRGGGRGMHPLTMMERQIKGEVFHISMR